MTVAVTMLPKLSGLTEINGGAVNNSGEVVGYVTIDNSFYFEGTGFSYQGGTTTRLSEPSGYSYGNGQAINDSGEIAGYVYNYNSASTLTSAVTWQNGQATLLATPTGDNNAVADAINASGQVVGWASSGISATQAVLWQSGAATILATLSGGTAADALGINASGQIVGYSTDSSGNTHGVLWQSGSSVPTSLGNLSGFATNSQAVAINASGQIVGTANNGTTEHSYLWQNGVMTDLGVLPGYTNTVVLGMNDAGQVVGYCTNDTLAQINSAGLSGAVGLSLDKNTYSNAAAAGHAFLWQNGVMTDLSSLAALTGQTVSYATSINNSGEIVVGVQGFGSAGTMTVAPSAALSGTQANFTPGSFIDLPYISFQPSITTLTYSGGVLTATEGSISLGSVTIGGTGISSLSSGNFYVTTDNAGGTEIGVSASPFSISDTTASSTSSSVGAANAGSLTYLQRQYVASGSDSVNITANIPDIFLSSSSTSTNNALAVTSGTNVLNGANGSNFLVGTTSGSDTFFVDGRGTSPVWNTVVNFHKGDAATLWGVDSSTSLHYEASAGAVGYQGFTIHADTQHNGSYSCSITLAGVSQSQVTETYGTVSGTSYLYITWAS